jgi:hypothetical protein
LKVILLALAFSSTPAAATTYLDELDDILAFSGDIPASGSLENLLQPPDEKLLIVE